MNLAKVTHFSQPTYSLFHHWINFFHITCYNKIFIHLCLPHSLNIYLSAYLYLLILKCLLLWTYILMEKIDKWLVSTVDKNKIE